MNQRAVRTIVFAGLAVATFVLSFLGCNQDYGDIKGHCQAADAGSADAGSDDCIISRCKADGTPAPEPVPNAEKKVCFRGENEGVCVDGECALICETPQMGPCKCASDTACPDDKVCIDWACDMTGECKSTLTADGTLIDPLEMGDCLKSVCQNGTPKPVPDMDPPPDMPGDCKMPACKDGVSAPLPANDPPADTPKDCLKPACMNGMSMPVPDDTDPPDPNDPIGCTTYKCEDGTIKSSNLPVGTMCPTGACDGNGACKLEDGQTCVNGPECSSGNCADTVCCNTNCTDECKSCNQATAQGVCTNIPYYQEDPSYIPAGGGAAESCDVAVNGAVCNGNGKCLRKVNVPCDMGSQCISNTCTNMKCLGATGELCTATAQCVSNMCDMGNCK